MLDDDAMLGKVGSELLPTFCLFGRFDDRRPSYFIPRQSAADLKPHSIPLVEPRADGWRPSIARGVPLRLPPTLCFNHCPVMLSRHDGDASPLSDLSHTSFRVDLVPRHQCRPSIGTDPICHNVNMAIVSIVMNHGHILVPTKLDRGEHLSNISFDHLVCRRLIPSIRNNPMNDRIDSSAQVSLSIHFQGGGFQG